MLILSTFASDVHLMYNKYEYRVNKASQAGLIRYNKTFQKEHCANDDYIATYTHALN